MVIQITSDVHGVIGEYDVLTANELYKKVGESLLLSKSTLPDTRIVTFNGTVVAKYSLKKRGAYIENGIEYPSMYVTSSSNSVDVYFTHNLSEYEDRYLTCVHEESNNYKFYWLKPCRTKLNATYGRIGSEKGEIFGEKSLATPYNISEFWIRYYEKISKGYVDQTDIFLSDDVLEPEKTSEKNTKSCSNTVSKKLYDRLISCSRQYVADKLISNNVTKAQYEKCQKLFDELMHNTSDVNDFNEILKDLITVSPRKTRYVDEQLVHSTNDFEPVIHREESLINSMSALVSSSDKSYFDDFGIKIYEANEKQVEEVKKHVDDHLKDRIVNVYRVIDNRQKTAFDKYCKDNHISKIKQFWHGSTDENWYSIIVNSLQLNPNAKITGKMFGKGVYFAPSAQKSLGYTSCNGSYWSHGKSTSGLLGLYAIAYGKPFDTDSPQGYADEAFIKSKGCDSLHAHKGSYLRNDEVIVYNEKALVLNYLVEIGA